MNEIILAAQEIESQIYRTILVNQIASSFPDKDVQAQGNFLHVFPLVPIKGAVPAAKVSI
jgi:hypothetical protein